MITMSKKEPWRKHKYARWGKVGEVPVEWLLQYQGNKLRRDEKRMNKLIEDIKRNGIKQPLVLIIGKNDRRVKLAEGNHRLHAAIHLGLDKVPVYVIVQQNVVFGHSAICHQMGKVPKEGFFPADAHPDDVFDKLAD